MVIGYVQWQSGKVLIPCGVVPHMDWLRWMIGCIKFRTLKLENGDLPAGLG